MIEMKKRRKEESQTQKIPLSLVREEDFSLICQKNLPAR